MPRGIVGSERGGVLTNQLKDNPYSVVLLDEVEKASPSMLNLFLQAFDEGWITDGRGKRVYLSDAIVIMTSNIGSEHFRKLTSPLGFLLDAGRRRAGAGRDHARARTPVLAGVPQPHRRGRAVRAADEGRSAGRSRVQQIAQDRGDAGAKRPHADASTPAALEQLVQEGYSLAFGARFLKRVIDERIKLPISQRWTRGHSTSSADVRDGQRRARRSRRRPAAMPADIRPRRA